MILLFLHLLDGDLPKRSHVEGYIGVGARDFFVASLLGRCRPHLAVSVADVLMGDRRLPLEPVEEVVMGIPELPTALGCRPVW